MALRRDTHPLLLDSFATDGGAIKLERLALSSGDSTYNEQWLQQLVDRTPSLLPIAAIEPTWCNAVSVCTELPTPSGFIDNLLMTSDGGIILVECKLWRNPQARRSVVGQILDYAKDVSRWSYDDLEQHIKRTKQEPSWTLYDAIASQEDEYLDEVLFHDSVARNLKIGRFLLLIVGDGIHEGTEQLVEMLQRHMGMHFTFALVELGLWRIPGESRLLVQPSVPVKTILIERGVLTIDNGFPVIGIPTHTPETSKTLSSELFYEQLDTVERGLSDRFRVFLSDITSFDVECSFMKTANLFWLSPTGRKFSLAYLRPDGTVDLSNTHRAESDVQQSRIRYLERLAERIPNGRVKKTNSVHGWSVSTLNGPLTLSIMMKHTDAWREAIEFYIQDLMKAIDSMD